MYIVLARLLFYLSSILPIRYHDSLANEFRDFYATYRYFIVAFIILRYPIWYLAFPWAAVRPPRKKPDFIWFSFLTSFAFIKAYVLAVVTSSISFTGKTPRVHTSVVM